MATPDEASHIDCDVRALVGPDITTVEALSLLQLTARRLGKRIRFRHACPEMQELVALMGLCDVLPGAGSRIEPWREAEEGEQARRVEEEADP